VTVRKEIERLRGLADRAPSLIGGALEMGIGTTRDLASIPAGLRGDDLSERDPAYIRRTLPLLRRLFNTYFRGEVRGLENIPASGPVLLVGNHSGGLMIADTFVFSLELYARFGPERPYYQLAHDLAARLPTGGFLRRYGTVAASHQNARAAFAEGAALLVYPGGDYETFRPTWHSDQIEFGGRQGFVRLALEEGVPIVPVVSIGGQETALFLTRGERVARLLGLDRRFRINVLPLSIGPPLGATLLDLPGRFPLPAKITIEVLPQIEPREQFGPDPDGELVYEQVTAEMQRSLDRLSEERTVPLVG
jgi:1-acyl-sn-glycerol-3-phosphate acyltransferase